MSIWEFFQVVPVAWIVIAFVVGATVGSFLNVVIYRLPKMMETQWAQHCAESTKSPPTAPTSAYNLAVPRSQCPQCHNTLRAVELVPILSYIWQRGRCRHCGGKIAWRYPGVELLAATMSAIVAWHWGASFLALTALAATGCLIVLTFIDVDHQLLPDSITLPLLWAGLLLSLANVWVDSRSAILGATLGYMLLWTVYWVYKLLTGREGLGFGDFKLLAALGAWFGWQSIPLILFLASCVGAIAGISVMLARGRDRHMAIPFGPYLAAAGWVYMLWGTELLHWYLRFTHWQ